MSIRKELAQECAEELAKRLAERSYPVNEKPDLAALAVVLHLGEIADSLEVISKQLTQIRLEQARAFHIGANVSLENGEFVEIEPQG